MNITIFLIPVGILILYFILNEFIRYRRRIEGIPGPPGLPIVGNLHQVCQDKMRHQPSFW